jgi:hypothetical protein
MLGCYISQKIVEQGFHKYNYLSVLLQLISLEVPQ